MTFCNLRRTGRGQSMHRYGSQSSPIDHTLHMFKGLPRIKEYLRKEFADLANDFSKRLHAISLELSGVAGLLEVRIHSAKGQQNIYDEIGPASASKGNPNQITNII